MFSIIVLGIALANIVVHPRVAVIRFGESEFVYGFGPEESLTFSYCKAGPVNEGPSYPDILDPQFRWPDDFDVEGYNKALDEYNAKQRIWEAGVPVSWSHRWMGFGVSKFPWPDLRKRLQSVLKGTVYEVRIPLWVFFVLSTVLPLHGAIRILKRERRRRRVKAMRCVKCGYDVRVNSGRCPECGEAVANELEGAQ